MTLYEIRKGLCHECNASGDGVRFSLSGDENSAAFLCRKHFVQNLEVLEEAGDLEREVRPLDRVCLLSYVDSAHIGHLTYADGTIRTYRPDDVDARAGAVVFVQAEEDFWAVLKTGALCAVPVRRAMRELGWGKRRFADV